MLTDGQGTKWRRNIAENFNRLSRVHEGYRQTDRQQTDRRRHIATRTKLTICKPYVLRKRTRVTIHSLDASLLILL